MKALPRRTFVVRGAVSLAIAPVASHCGSPTNSEGAGGSDGSSSSDASTHPTMGGPTHPDEPGTGSTSSTGAPGSSTDTAEETTSPTTDDGSSSTGPVSCEETPSDIEGPFYRPDIPVGGDLDLHGDPGVPVVLRGVVRAVDDCQPIEGAIVELWHATPRPPASSPGDLDATYDNSEAYRYYGQVATGPDGRYTFTTLHPGWYRNGASYRPAHFHVKVWIDGEARLTSQIYFVDDPFNDDDNWFNPLMAIDPDVDGEAELDLVV